MNGASSTPPGWYQNSQGQLQWWDGTTWGPLADMPARYPGPGDPALPGAAPIPNRLPAPAGAAVPAVPKPKISRFAWWAIGLAALAIIIGIVGAWLPSHLVHQALQETGSYTSDHPLPAVEIASQIGRFSPILALTAVVFAIVGIIRSRKKAASIVALAISLIALASPVLLVIFGALLYVIAGMFGQATGSYQLG